MSVSTLAPPARRGPSPRQRAKRRRLIQYAVLVIAIVVLLLVADLPQIGQVFFRSRHDLRHPDPGFRHSAAQHHYL